MDDEQRRAIVLFFPNLNALSHNIELGLLTSIIVNDCSLEIYCDPIDESDVLDGLRKLFSVFSVLQSQAEREGKTLDEDELPKLWLLVPSVTVDLLNGFGAHLNPGWPCGVYFMAEAFKVAIVAINELAVTRETLWLRLLGRGETQRQAIDELLALPVNNLLRQKILRLINHWHTALVQNLDDLTPDEQELVINLSVVCQS
ncbi:hypothetical protein WDZ92_40960 [Nostoc sp. NIES-2111]